jgi:hypothetical protein
VPYWIKHQSDELYWGRDGGWVEPDIDFMAEYSDEQQLETVLPPEGQWERRAFDLSYELLFWVEGAFDEDGESVNGEQIKAALRRQIEKIERTGEWRRYVIGPTSSNPAN